MNTVVRKANALLQLGLVRCFSGIFPLYIVNEYPRSGGTWLGQMLGRALDVPFANSRDQFPVLRSAIMHGHYLNPWGMRNVVVIWRDGRDVMVSWYHHCLFKNELFNAARVDITRRDLPFKDYEDVEKNLPVFIRYCFTRKRFPRFSWAEFVRRLHARSGVTHVYYEALHQNAASEVQRIVFELTGRKLECDKAAAIAEEFSFARQSGRQLGQENKGSFMRKGITGDWRNYFNQEARELFDYYAGEELILLGYERDRTWVNVPRS